MKCYPVLVKIANPDLLQAPGPAKSMASFDNFVETARRASAKAERRAKRDAKRLAAELRIHRKERDKLVTSRERRRLISASSEGGGATEKPGARARVPSLPA